MLNVILSDGMTGSASMFLPFKELNLKFIIYDGVSLCWLGKPYAISQDDTNVIIFQANRRKKENIFLSKIQCNS